MNKPAEVAKLIRKELKIAFPGYKFSVTIGSGSVWGTIYVRWENSLSREQIEKAIGKYQTYSGWDAHSDLDHHDNRHTDIPQVSNIWFHQARG